MDGKTPKGGDATTYGPGALKNALGRNPNEETELNSAPAGPFAHEMGFTDDGGMKGKTTVSHRGRTFHFK